MRNTLVLLFIAMFSFSATFASDIEDTSILDELEKQEVKQLDFDFNLKSFESCEGLENVMGDYIKNYWSTNKDRWSYPMPMYRTMGINSVDMVMEDSVME